MPIAEKAWQLVGHGGRLDGTELIFALLPILSVCLGRAALTCECCQIVGMPTDIGRPPSSPDVIATATGYNGDLCRINSRLDIIS
jgi:hypothetical protein